MRGVAGADALKDDWLAAITDRAFIGDDALPRTHRITKRKSSARARGCRGVRGHGPRVWGIAAEYHAVVLRLARCRPRSIGRRGCESAVASLVYRVRSAPRRGAAQHLPRYLRAMAVRLDKYPAGSGRDARHAAAIAELWKLWFERRSRLRKAGGSETRLEDYRWQIEELRVSLSRRNCARRSPSR